MRRLGRFWENLRILAASAVGDKHAAMSDLSDNTLLPSWEVQYTLFVESYYKKSVKVRFPQSARGNSGTHSKGRVTRHCRVGQLTTGCRRLVLPIARGIWWKKLGKLACSRLFCRIPPAGFTCRLHPIPGIKKPPTAVTIEGSK